MLALKSEKSTAQVLSSILRACTEGRGSKIRVIVSTQRMEFVVANDPTQDSAEATREVCGFRWKIEHLRREVKQRAGPGGAVLPKTGNRD